MTTIYRISSSGSTIQNLLRTGNRLPPPLKYSWCTHFAATCSLPPGAAVPLALPSPSSTIVCVHTRLGQQEGEKRYIRLERAMCTVTNAVSWLHLFSLVARSHSISVGIYARAERKFILSKSRQTLRACVVQKLSNCLITSVYFRRWSVHLRTHTYFCGHAHYVRKRISSFTFLVLVPFLQKNLNILGLTNRKITLYLDTLQDLILATFLK
jgi:hypothetical protein